MRREATFDDGYMAAKKFLVEIKAQYCETPHDAVDAVRKVLAAAKNAPGPTREVA